MDPVIFNETNTIEDEEYVLVNADDMVLDLDGETFSYEDDDFVVFSTFPEEKQNFETKSDLKLSTSVVSLEESERKLDTEMGDLLTKLENAPGDSFSGMEEMPELKIDSKLEIPSVTNTKNSSNTTNTKTESFENTSVCGSRLSNKKRRKKLKMMKKAAASAEAAASLAAMRQKSSSSSPPKPTSRTRRSKLIKSKKVHNSSNIAVACATESLNDFREKHNMT